MPPALESGVIVRKGTAVVMVFAPDVVACPLTLFEKLIIIAKTKSK
jgi:hypothetical protein